MAHALHSDPSMRGLPARLAQAATVLGLALVGACAPPSGPTPEDRVRFLSDPDGDGVMTEEGCTPAPGSECLSLPSPDPSCVYLEILETTFVTVDAQGNVISEEATLCLTCLDAGLAEVYTDCGGILPAPEPVPSEPPPFFPGEWWCQTLPSGDETTICWDCVGADGSAGASGCASIGQSVPPGTFCTAGEADGVPCVWCCDLTGLVLLEQCDDDRLLE